jgi:phage/plasmid-associated DNA primase
VLNLQTGSIEATDRNKYLTERIPTPFIPEETFPRIDELVRWIANYDPAVEKFFWRWMRYCLTGDMSLHKSLFLKGCGRNKKITLRAGLFEGRDFRPEGLHSLACQ